MKKLLKLCFSASLLCLFSMSMYGQRTINGTIIDAETNEPLIGANVLIKGFSTGTITDIDGSYSLVVPEGATELTISYTGYNDQSMMIGDNSRMDISLSQGSLLDEVVVVGYGTVRKRDLTGSVASLKEEDFNKGVVISADQLLQGRVAGVNIVNNSGQPGGQATVKIRGNNSIRSGADPLYVVDGIPLDGRTAKAGLLSTDIGNIENSNPLNFLNPADIASIEVLKDASSAAIYGSRASNGVILITTKKGRDGETQVSLNTSFGTSSTLKKYDVLSGDAYRAALTQYELTSGDGGSSVDVYDEIARSGSIQNYNLSIGTGGEDSRVRFSAGYQDVKGIIKDSGIKRYTATLNAQYDLFDDRAGIDFFVVSSHTNENIAPISTNAGFTGNLVGQALQWNPTVPLMTDGEFTTGLNNPLVGATTINPLQLLNGHSEIANTTTILGSISPYLNITDNLQYRYRFGMNYGTGVTRGAITKDLNVQGIEGLGFAGVSTNQLITNLHTHTLNYTTEINDNISLSALGGFEYQKFDFSGYAFAGFGFDDVEPNVDIIYNLQNSNNDNRIVNSFADPISELQSYFGRVNLGVGDRLNITATVRADGSTKFGANNSYGIFPSAAVAWNLMNESFLEDGPFDDLKLRLGWGVTGNQEFPAGAALQRVVLNNNTGTTFQNAANENLQWEESTTLNFGLDFGLFDYRLTGTIDYYSRVTNNLLIDAQLQEPGPPVRAWKNLDAELVNSGIEIGLNAYIIEKENFGLNLGVNLAFLNNELRNYSGPDILTGDLFGQGSTGSFIQKHVDGKPLNTYFVRDFQGLDDAGNSIYANDGALIEAGDPNADIIAGFTIGVNAGDLNFGMNWNGAFGHSLYNNTAMSVIPIGNLGNRNIDANLLGGSQEESTTNPIASSSRYLESGDFLKLANATISYNLGKISSFENINVSLTGQNLIILTDYTGYDPEINTVNLRNGVPSSGIEYIPYPSARTILVGLNVSF